MAEPNATVKVGEISFRFSISEISKLNGNVFSPEYLIDGVPWKICAYKNVSGVNPTLGLYICPAPNLKQHQIGHMWRLSHLHWFHSHMVALQGDLKLAHMCSILSTKTSVSINLSNGMHCLMPETTM